MRTYLSAHGDENTIQCAQTGAKNPIDMSGNQTGFPTSSYQCMGLGRLQIVPQSNSTDILIPGALRSPRVFKGSDKVTKPPEDHDHRAREDLGQKLWPPIIDQRHIYEPIGFRLDQGTTFCRIGYLHWLESRWRDTQIASIEVVQYPLNTRLGGI